MHLPVRVGGDVALFKGVQKALLEEDVRRRGRASTAPSSSGTPAGFEAVAEALAGTDFDVLVEESGIPEADMRALAACSPARTGSSPAGRWASPSTPTPSRTFRRS